MKAFMARLKAVLGQAPLALLACGAVGAQAGEQKAADVADNLMEAFGEIVKMYHMYSASDGRTYIEVMDVPPTRGPWGLVTYFDRPVRRVVIGYWKDGQESDYHYAGHKNLLIYLQGTQIIETGDGREYRLRPGTAVLAEDWTGLGHKWRCVAPDKQRVCLVIQITIDDLDKTLPLRPPPTGANHQISR